jgi:hypothetical protein
MIGKLICAHSGVSMLTAAGQFDVYHYCRSILTQIDEDIV